MKTMIDTAITIFFIALAIVSYIVCKATEAIL